MTKPTEQFLNRNFGLDLMRSFSIWLVILQHAGVNIPGLSPMAIGGIGVEIFFVLSGFLIGGIILNDLKNENSLFNTLKGFWFRRWLRILPLYYFILLVKFIFIDNSVGWNIFYYIFFLQNNFYGISFLDVSWSLVIEEWFYIVSPIFLFISKKLLKKTPKVLVSILIFILLINVLRFFYVIHGNVPYTGVNGNPPFRFDSLFLGILLAFIKDNYINFYRKLSHLGVFLIGVSLFVLYIFIYWSIANPVNKIDSTIWIRTFGFFILPFSVSLTIPYIYNIHKPKTKAMFYFVTQTSVLTYAIYLIHPFVYGFLLQEKTFLNFMFSIIATYVFAWIAYNSIEKPFLRLREKTTSFNALKN